MGPIDFSGLLYLGIAIGIVLALVLIGLWQFIGNHVSVVWR